MVSAKVRDPLAHGSERVPVLVEVALLPARAEAEDHPALADVIDRPGHVGEELRVPVRVAGDERPELDPLGRLGPGRQERPALEVRTVRVAVEREEVVPGVDDVVAELLRAHGATADVAVGAVLRMELGGDPDGAHGSSGLRWRPSSTFPLRESQGVRSPRCSGSAPSPG